MGKITPFEKKVSDFIVQASTDCKKEGGFEFWKTLAGAEKLLEKMPSKKLGKVEKGVVVQGKLFVSKGAVVKAGTRIEGNVFVGKGSVVGPNAFLRGFVVLGEDCFVGQSEAKNSIFLKESRAPHFNYVGDSILCENVNLGAGAKIANLRHDGKNIFVQVNGQKVDSGCRKLGALLCEGVKAGVNSSINCGSIVPAGTKILPNQFFK